MWRTHRLLFRASGGRIGAQLGALPVLIAVVVFEEHPELGAFDAVLAATALGHEAQALVSADADFRVLRGLRHFEPGTRALRGAPGIARP